jgi:acyl carrier protein
MFITSFVREKMAAHGQHLADELPDNCDLLLSGMIDSMGLLELVTAAAEHYSRDIDFEALDPEQMTIVGPLCRFMSEALNDSGNRMDA